MRIQIAIYGNDGRLVRNFATNDADLKSFVDEARSMISERLISQFTVTVITGEQSCAQTPVSGK